MSRSEIAQLRQQIELELDALRRGMAGIAAGTARHAFIHARMERLGTCQDSLAGKIGASAASEIVCHLYIQAMEREHQPDILL
ncbi:MAG TPA: hypothetical protein VKX46_18370 [Ktedonobacteraceae bacterium]|nr:hypothetical protein [Ktedonobacteraceae bacterium]